MDGDKAQRMARTLRVCRFVLMSVQLGAVLEGSMAPVWLSDPETPLQGRVGHSKEQHDGCVWQHHHQQQMGSRV